MINTGTFERQVITLATIKQIRDYIEKLNAGNNFGQDYSFSMHSEKESLDAIFTILYEYIAKNPKWKFGRTIPNLGNYGALKSELLKSTASQAEFISIFTERERELKMVHEQLLNNKPWTELSLNDLTYIGENQYPGLLALFKDKDAVPLLINWLKGKGDMPGDALVE